MSKFPEQSYGSIADRPIEERHAIVLSWLGALTTFYQRAADDRDSLRAELATAHEALGEVSAILQQRGQPGWEERLLGIVNAALKRTVRL